MLKNEDKFKYIDFYASFWYYHLHRTGILLDSENNILKINSMKDLIKIDLILERAKL